jgi:hypothetical protein
VVLVDIDTGSSSVAEVSAALPEKPETTDNTQTQSNFEEPTASSPGVATELFDYGVKIDGNGPGATNRSEEVFAENQRDDNSDNAPYRETDIPQITRPIEYKQASEQDSARNDGIEKLLEEAQLD